MLTFSQFFIKLYIGIPSISILYSFIPFINNFIFKFFGGKMKSNRKAHHSREFKDSIIKRLNRIEGQIRGIKKMIENDCYCDEILNQITSTRSALAGVQEKLLNEHIKTCIVERIKEEDLNVIEEVTSTIRRIIK